MKRLIAATAGLAMSATATFASEPVNFNELDNTAGSADSCIIGTRSGNGLSSATSFSPVIPVNSIQACFKLGQLWEAYHITAMKDGEAIKHYSSSHIGRFNEEFREVDIAPE